KTGLELLQASSLPFTTSPRALNSDSNDDGADGDDAPDSSTWAHCSSKSDNMGSPRNSCVGNIRSNPDNRNSCIGMRGNQFPLLRFRLKPARQIVSPAPEPVRLLLMEVKEVFS